jgi:hypothetical protein
MGLLTIPFPVPRHTTGPTQRGLNLHNGPVFFGNWNEDTRWHRPPLTTGPTRQRLGTDNFIDWTATQLVDTQEFFAFNGGPQSASTNRSMPPCHFRFKKKHVYAFAGLAAYMATSAFRTSSSDNAT